MINEESFDSFSPNLNYEDVELIVKKIKSEQDEEKKKILKEELILKFKNCIENLVSKYSVTGFSKEDLISESNLILLSLIDKYDVDKHKFVGYAVSAVKKNLFSLISKTERRKKCFWKHKELFIYVDDSSIQDTDDNMDNEFILDALKKAADSLTEQELFLYMNVFLRKTPLVKCAKQTNLPYSTCRNRIASLKRKLKFMLEKYL